jgi:hypothetical protein
VPHMWQCVQKCLDCQAKLCCCALLSDCGRCRMRSSRGLCFRPHSLGKHTASWLRLNGQVWVSFSWNSHGSSQYFACKWHVCPTVWGLRLWGGAVV